LAGGLIVLYVGKIEKVRLDKTCSIIEKTVTTILCTTTTIAHNLKDIVGFQIIKRGKETASSNTVRYKIIAIINNNTKIGIKTTRELIQAQIWVFFAYGLT